MSERLDDPIEAYLDDLLTRLPGSPREVRHTLAEVDAHLHAAFEDGIAAGLAEDEARREAVRRVGPAVGVIDAPRLLPRITVELRRRLVLAALLLGAVGGIAIGVGGLMAWGVQGIWGDHAIATPFPTGSYTPADCARWLAGDTATHSCVAAMLADHAFDVLRNTAIAGLLGVVAAIVLRLVRTRWGAGGTRPGRVAGVEYLVGAALAALSSAGLALVGLDAVLVTHAQGSGAEFSLAIAAALAAGWFVAFGRRAVRAASPPAGG